MLVRQINRQGMAAGRFDLEATIHSSERRRKILLDSRDFDPVPFRTLRRSKAWIALHSRYCSRCTLASGLTALRKTADKC